MKAIGQAFGIEKSKIEVQLRKLGDLGEIAEKFKECNEVIVENGSDEQQELYLSNLERHKDVYPDFYVSILNDFLDSVSHSQSVLRIHQFRALKFQPIPLSV